MEGQDRETGRGGRPQHVPEEDLPLRYAATAQGPHVVQLKLLDERAADLLRGAGDAVDDERDDREGQRRHPRTWGRVGCDGRHRVEPAQGEGEIPDQEDTDDEARDRAADDGQDLDQPVDPAALDRRGDAEDGGQDRGEHNRDDDHDKGDGQSAGDRREDRLVGEPGLTELTADGVEQPVGQAVDQWLVQAQFSCLTGDVRLRGLVPHDVACDVAAAGEQQDKGEARDGEEHGDP